MFMHQRRQRACKSANEGSDDAVLLAEHLHICTFSVVSAATR